MNTYIKSVHNGPPRGWGQGAPRGRIPTAHATPAATNKQEFKSKHMTAYLPGLARRKAFDDGSRNKALRLPPADLTPPNGILYAINNAVYRGIIHLAEPFHELTPPMIHLSGLPSFIDISVTWVRLEIYKHPPKNTAMGCAAEVGTQFVENKHSLIIKPKADVVCFRIASSSSFHA